VRVSIARQMSVMLLLNLTIPGSGNTLSLTLGALQLG